MKKVIAGFLLLTFVQLNFAQENLFTEQDINVNPFVDGTLTMPESIGETQSSLVIFIQGSGPTNRDGNQPMMKNDGMKKISRDLAEHGIASFRFDKRIFKMNKLRIQEEDLRFEDFVTDARSIVEYFDADQNFDNIIIAGHSEGSLIGMLAAQEPGVDAFISLAGAGRTIDTIVVEQLAKQSKELSENAANAFAEISEHGSTENYSQYLESIFRPSVQPYISSWMKYDPALLIAQLKIPILIVAGDRDLQVDPADAEILQIANPSAEVVILEKMNHIFREINGDELENSKAYNEPNRPLHPELIPALVEFIESVQ